jgi:PPOX class probable F420-dependent enzyme
LLTFRLDGRLGLTPLAPDIVETVMNAKYLNLETYRRNGAAVRTPVWFAAAPAVAPGAAVPKFYIYSTADSGKVKRVRRNGAARFAPCDISGNVTGPWTDAVAEIVAGEEFRLGMRLLDRKYFPRKQILNLLALFRRRERVVLAIRPVATKRPSDDSPASPKPNG